VLCKLNDADDDDDDDDVNKTSLPVVYIECGTTL